MSLFRNPPETRYADTGEGYVGYVTIGEGPRDILFATQMVTNVEMMWESPDVAGYFDRLSASGRVVLMEYRGIGVSDPFPFARNPTFDDLLVDSLTVMDAAGVDECIAIGDVEAVPMAIMLGATYPNRISELVLVNGYARLLRADHYPIGMPAETAAVVVEWVRQNWGKPSFFVPTAPSIAGDQALLEWLAHFQRLAVSPGEATKAFDWYRAIDVTAILPSIQQRTLVVGREDAAYHRPSHARYMAEHIPNAELALLPGVDTSPYFVADPAPVLGAIEEFLTGQRTVDRVVDRTLATVMFTDIVDSTGLASELGDQRWMRLLQQHNEVSQQYVERFGGRLVGTTGDGVVATFDGPTRALTCAAQLGAALGSLGIAVRAGLHTGEIELKDDGDIGGVAVHIASRVMSQSRGSRVSVSSTVKDLVAGSGIEFSSIGHHELKGVPGSWALYELGEVPAAFRLAI